MYLLRSFFRRCRVFFRFFNILNVYRPFHTKFEHFYIFLQTLFHISSKFISLAYFGYKFIFNWSMIFKFNLIYLPFQTVYRVALSSKMFENSRKKAKMSIFQIAKKNHFNRFQNICNNFRTWHMEWSIYILLIRCQWV